MCMLVQYSNMQLENDMCAVSMLHACPTWCASSMSGAASGGDSSRSPTTHTSTSPSHSQPHGTLPPPLHSLPPSTFQ